jgi:hypothetical protein
MLSQNITYITPACPTSLNRAIIHLYDVDQSAFKNKKYIKRPMDPDDDQHYTSSQKQLKGVEDRY